jgi:hypothetical protein
MSEAGPRSITRRSLVAASAAVPAGIVSAAMAPIQPALDFAGAQSGLRAEAADPVYAAIAAHDRAYAQIVALLAAQDAADAALQEADALARPALEARLDELCEAEGPLGRAEMDATRRLVATVPATLAGAAAALSYIRTLFIRDGYAPCEEDGYRALLLSTECAVCRAIALPEPEMCSASS